jgi:maltooligosyltrehalose trehalohydrolase
MLFQGEEYGSKAPFLFFADHEGELGDAVHRGRAEYMAQLSEPAGRVPNPARRETFTRSKLDPAERARGVHVTALYRDLLRLRRSDAAFAQQRADRVHGAVLGEGAFVLRFFCDAGDRLLVVSLGPALSQASIAEPLLAPPRGGRWSVRLSTEHADYGGAGVVPLDGEGGWRIGEHQATVLAPEPSP